MRSEEIKRKAEELATAIYAEALIRWQEMRSFDIAADLDAIARDTMAEFTALARQGR